MREPGKGNPHLDEILGKIPKKRIDGIPPAWQNPPLAQVRH